MTREEDNTLIRPHSPRRAEVSRKTRETEVTITLTLEGRRDVEVVTGLGFLDHMITALAFHAGWDLELKCAGDLDVDDHHSVEDCALCLGEAIDQSLGERVDLVRFGSAYAPLDEALARAVVDLSGRPFAMVDLGIKRATIGTVASENLSHFLHSLAVKLQATLHVDVLRGANDHHRAEAAYKATALALRQACTRTRPAEGTGKAVPSTKGVL